MASCKRVFPGDIESVFLAGESACGATPQVVFGLAKGGTDDLVASLASAGVEIVTPVTEAPGGWSSEFKDRRWARPVIISG